MKIKNEKRNRSLIRYMQLSLIILCGTLLVHDLVSACPTRQEEAVLFPLTLIDDGNRAYFVDQNKTPFLFTCDIAQALLNRLKIEDVRHYLDLRKSQGYNAFWFIIGTPNAMIDDTVFVKADSRNAYGLFPFENTVDDLSLPNGAYFRYVLDIVDEAEKRGMMAGIAPAYVGAAGGDLLPIMKNSGVEGCRIYGEYIGTLFRERPNVFWIHHGDQNPYNFGGASTAALTDAFVCGLQTTDNRYPRFHTSISRAIPSAGLSSSKSRTSSYKAQFDSAGKMVNPMPWLNLNNVYVKNRGQYGVMLSDMLDAWNTYQHKTNPKLPYFILDGVCDHYHDDARANRAQGYYALLSGAVGYFTGNIRICWFMSPDTYPASVKNWKEEIVSKENLTAKHAEKFFRSIPWWKLIPDTGHLLFQAGDSHCAVARSNDNRLVVLYMPTRRVVTANLTIMSGMKVKASWYNPRSGDAKEIGSFSKGVRKFNPPIGSNDNQEDWILLLEAQEL